MIETDGGGGPDEPGPRADVPRAAPVPEVGRSAMVGGEEAAGAGPAGDEAAHTGAMVDTAEPVEPAEPAIPPAATADTAEPVEPAEPAIPPAATADTAEPAEPAIPPAATGAGPADAAGADQRGGGSQEAGPAGADPDPVGGQDGEAPVTSVVAEESFPDPVLGEVTALRAGVERLALEVGELARLGQRNAGLVDRLHAENQKLRGGELAQAMAPLVRDVIRTHDDVVRLGEAKAADSGPNDLELVRQQLLGVLGRAGIESFVVADGDAFDPSRHQGVVAVDAADPAAAGTVASMMRCGFAWSDGRILRPAEVSVYRARPPADATSQPPQGDD